MPQAPQPLLSRLEPRHSMAGFSFECTTMGHQPQGQVYMPSWREDALSGATLGMVIFLSVALLLGEVAYWL